MATPPLPPPNLRAVAAAKARQYGVPVQVFLRQIQQESGFNPNARSSAGAQGIAQFIPSTARSYGLTNPYNAVASLDAAARYDADLLHRYGTIQRALSAYNSGRPDAYQDPHFAGGQTFRYVHDILGGAPAQTTLPPPPGTTGAPQGLAPALVPPPPPRQGLPPQLLSLFNQGNEMFGLPALPQSFGSAPQQVAAGTAAQPSPSTRGAAPPTLLPFKPGVPVAAETSVGGVHPTEGLAGFPARDYFAPAGTPVVAPITGKVIRLSGHDPAQGPVEGPHGPLGWSVYIQGKDGRVYYLTHMGSRQVRVGETLKAGQRIGTVANYAKYGTPSHIHMGVN